MIYVYSFIFCGIICLIGQIILDNTNLTPGHVTTMFVIFGGLLNTFNLYDKFIKWFGAGASVPITSFGHSLTHAVMSALKKDGALGLFTGMFDLTTAGIVAAMVFGFLTAMIFKAKD